MRALCLITIKPGMIDKVTELLSKKRKITKEVFKIGKKTLILNIKITENGLVSFRNNHRLFTRLKIRNFIT